MGVVTVTLDKCMNLRDKDGVGRSDPYVTLRLRLRPTTRSGVGRIARNRREVRQLFGSQPVHPFRI
jgi:hypothetical protein